jgi:outer membrane lipase/esterase
MFNTKSMNRYLRSLALATSLVGASMAAQAVTYSSMVVFGDSLSDTGNVAAVTGFIPLPPYATGRFSNGPVYTDVLAAGLGVSSLHSLGGGTNFAFGGATIVPNGTGTPSLTEQSNGYLAATGGIADAGALYVVFGGGNDIRGSASTADAVNAANGLVSIVQNLIAAGAANILVPNLPDLGATPEAIGGGGAGVDSTARSLTYNSTLAAGLATLSGANIIELDVFGILNNMIANPGSFGITNTDEVCFEGATGVGGGGAVCSNPDEYIFWDGIHPTAAIHEELGNIAFGLVSPVPVPAAAWLFGSALLGLAGAGRKKVA